MDGGRAHPSVALAQRSGEGRIEGIGRPHFGGSGQRVFAGARGVVATAVGGLSEGLLATPRKPGKAQVDAMISSRCALLSAAHLGIVFRHRSEGHRNSRRTVFRVPRLVSN